jgi:hypothetical protein
VSSDSLTPQGDPGELAACLASAADGHEALATVVGATFDTLQTLVAELEKRQRAWQADRQRAMAEASRRAAELAEGRERFDDERAQWRKELRAMRHSIETLVQQLDLTEHKSHAHP